MLDKKTWYVYLLCYPDTEIPFYVGKGTGDRMYMHERFANNRSECNKWKKAIIRRILASGKQVTKKKIAEFTVEQDAYIYEWAMINFYHEHIVNINRGGGNAHIRNTVASIDPEPTETEVVPVIEEKVSFSQSVFLSLEQAAKMLDVSKRTITRQIESGKLVGFKVGKSWRFRAESLDNYIKEQEASAKEDAATEIAEH